MSLWVLLKYLHSNECEDWFDGLWHRREVFGFMQSRRLEGGFAVRENKVRKGLDWVSWLFRLRALTETLTWSQTTGLRVLSIINSLGTQQFSAAVPSLSSSLSTRHPSRLSSREEKCFPTWIWKRDSSSHSPPKAMAKMIEIESSALEHLGFVVSRTSKKFSSHEQSNRWMISIWKVHETLHLHLLGSLLLFSLYDSPNSLWAQST